MVRGIDEVFDLELTGAAETAMEQFSSANLKTKGGVDRHTSLEEFGSNLETETTLLQFELDLSGIEPEGRRPAGGEDFGSRSGSQRATGTKRRG